MLAASDFATLDEPLSAELAASGACAFEPVVHPKDDYAALLAFHGIEPDRLVLIDPHSDTHASDNGQLLADISDTLAADGWQIGIIGDPAESERTGAVLGAMQSGALYLSGAMTRDTQAALIGNARLVLSERAQGSAVAQLAHERGTPLISLDSGRFGETADAIVGAALAELHTQCTAHPGLPFTLHTPMLKDAA
ncbi:hypothetical protein AWB64_01613 [Caballeronia sordidicola]|uniref:Uncharacterized protein n=1 Tax=Caballeronia sordidicola TaxID=196367 RepID=A0A158FPB0_CABSO|nr:hypothetical protein [Caballeronia sordidicola]SAL21698.1 hypothetical protein AWB64_01613 [Caballeronia sordidicola]